MSYILKVDESQHIENFGKWQFSEGATVNLVGSSLNDLIPVHKMMLVAGSGFLRRLFEETPISELDSVILPDVDVEVVALFVELLYNGAVLCPPDKCESIMELVQMLQFEHHNEIALTLPNNEDQSDMKIYSEDNSTAFEEEDKSALNMLANLQDTTVFISNSPEDDNVSLNGSDMEFPVKTDYEEPSPELNNMISRGKQQTMYSSDSLDVMFSCHQCNKSFSSAGYLQNHMERCNKPFLLRCSLCSFQAKGYAGIKHHNRTVHQQHKEVCCEKCDKKFATVKHLKNHVIRVHNPKNFSCGFCSYKSYQSSHLKAHISSVHFKEKPNCCVICGKSFAVTVCMNTHLKKVHNVTLN